MEVNTADGFKNPFRLAPGQDRRISPGERRSDRSLSDSWIRSLF